ncbi:MAG: hypothetical protein H7X94_06510, partial [Vallitaleaceae bacterium]|nr:hypothetical protein [Vallitaleaceae bacterium]
MGNRFTGYQMAFMVLIALLSLPFTLMPILSTTYSERHELVRAKDGALDLSGISLKHEKMIPLEGEWYFYHHQWIITDQNQRVSVPILQHIPTSWNEEARGATFDVTYDYGSYELVIQDYSFNSEVIAYIPNFQGAYRVFLDGQLVASSGEMSKNPKEVQLNQNVVKNYLSLPQQRNIHLVIEVSSRYYPIVNHVPILVESNEDYANTKLSITWASMYLGGFILLLLLFGLLFFVRDHSLFSGKLLLVLITISLRIAYQGEIGATISLLFPQINSEPYRQFVEVTTLFLPFFMYLFVKEILIMPLERKKLLSVLLLTCVGFLGWLFNGFASIRTYQMLFWLISFIPALLPINDLWIAVRQKKPYGLMIASAYFTLIFGLSVEIYSFLGIYIYNTSMVLP